jgi:hypothetical protein
MTLVRTAALSVLCFSSALGLAQTASTAGAWSIYSYPSDSSAHARTLIQTKSHDQYWNNLGQPVEANLDVICSHGRLVAIALDTNSKVSKQDVNPRGGVDTTPVSFRLDQQTPESEPWQVLDDRETLTPYTAIFHGKHKAEWAERLLSSETLTFSFHGEQNTQPVRVSFSTAGFKDALASSGCTY